MLFKVFFRNVYFGGYLNETWHAFIVYMFRRRPEVLHSAGDNAVVSGFGKGPIAPWGIMINGVGGGGGGINPEMDGVYGWQWFKLQTNAMDFTNLTRDIFIWPRGWKINWEDFISGRKQNSNNEQLRI